MSLDKSLTGTLLPERTTRLFLYYVFLHPAKAIAELNSAISSALANSHYAFSTS